MRILFIGGKTKFGLAPFISSQANSLRESGKEVEEFIFNNQDKTKIISELIRLKNCLRRNHYDIIHAHYTYFAYYALLFTKRKKVVVSFMGSDLYGMFDDKNRLKPIGYLNIVLSKFLLRIGKKFIVKSSRMLVDIPPKYHHETVIVPNGVDLKIFKPIQKSKALLSLNLPRNSMIKILFLGDKNDPRKNFKLLDNSLKNIEKDNIEVIAPFPIESKLISLYLNACDILVMPSLREGSPNIIKEAMACNMPIVATDVGDVKWLLGNDSGHFLTSFDEKTTTQNILKAIEFHENNHETNGRRRLLALGLDSHTVAKKIISLYNN